MAKRNSNSTNELAAELARLGDRVEALEDARELDAAIQRNAGKPLRLHSLLGSRT